MADPCATRRDVPRLFLIRHGQTEWSENGRHTGTSDIPLTAKGEEIIVSHRKRVVGPGKLLDPSKICHIFVSPRKRAQHTFELLFDAEATGEEKRPPYTIWDCVQEWDYGDYEGLTSKQIREKNPGWEIFRDGCPGGETVEDMTRRVDEVIAEVKKIHRAYLEDGAGRQDVLIVAHGHFSRCFIARWLNTPLFTGFHFTVDPAGIVLLTYGHRNLEETSLSGLNLHAL